MSKLKTYLKRTPIFMFYLHSGILKNSSRRYCITIFSSSCCSFSFTSWLTPTFDFFTTLLFPNLGVEQPDNRIRYLKVRLWSFLAWWMLSNQSNIFTDIYFFHIIFLSSTYVFGTYQLLIFLCPFCFLT